MLLLAPIFSFFTLALIASTQALPFAGAEGEKSGLDLSRCGATAGFSENEQLTPGYRCNCSPPADPELLKLLKGLRYNLLQEPHPMFLLSEMADNIHQHRLCPLICAGATSPQVEEDISACVISTMLDYMNSVVVPDTEPCPPKFNITYYPNRYPRYLVEVVCTAPTDGPHVKLRRCPYSSVGDGKSSRPTVRTGFCRSYTLGRMQYLTNDPHDDGCEGSPNWRTCTLQDVGIGCTCVHSL